MTVSSTKSIIQLLLLFLSLVYLSDAQTKVALQGRRLLLNGSPFIVRGIDYGVAPIGSWPDSFYSKYAWDWQSSKVVYDRDLALFQDLNVNSLRTYGWRNEINHTAFLDACLAKGIYVTVGFNWNWDDYNAQRFDKMKSELTNMVKNHAAHPAVLMWAIGNELNLGRGYQTAVWDFVKVLIDLAHTTERNMGVWHPASSPLADGNNIMDIIAARNAQVDVWMVQLYRGKSFGEFWSVYNKTSTKPVFVTEYGVDSYIAGSTAGEGEAQQAIWNSAMWTEINQNTDICSGSYLFQWADGLYKCGGSTSNAVQDLCPYTVGASFPGGQVEEEYFGMMRIANTQPTTDGKDNLARKAIYCAFKKLWLNEPRLVTYVDTALSCGVSGPTDGPTQYTIPVPTDAPVEDGLGTEGDNTGPTKKSNSSAVGIGVGVTIGLLVLIGLIVGGVFFYRRYQGQRGSPNPESPTPNTLKVVSTDSQSELLPNMITSSSIYSSAPSSPAVPPRSNVSSPTLPVRTLPLPPKPLPPKPLPQVPERQNTFYSNNSNFA